MIYTPGFDILYENAKTFKERKEVFALEEGTPYSNKLYVSLITKLYDCSIKKMNIDFDRIPKSNGDITKLTEYQLMIDSINVLKSLSTAQNVRIPKEILIIEKSIDNIKFYKDIFVKGFVNKNDFIMMEYNSYVMSCIHSIAWLISLYMEYTKDPTENIFVIKDTPSNEMNLTIKNLDKLNSAMSKGDFKKIHMALLTVELPNGVQKDQVAVATLIAIVTSTQFIVGVSIVLLIALISILREMVTSFYYLRLKYSKECECLAYFLEINKLELERNDKIDPEKKRKIIEKQEERRKQLLVLADMLRVTDSKGSENAKKEIKKQNKEITINDLNTDAGKRDEVGNIIL